MSVTLAQASSIVDATLKKARDLKQMPQTVVVLDPGGHIVCAKREDIPASFASRSPSAKLTARWVWVGVRAP